MTVKRLLTILTAAGFVFVYSCSLLTRSEGTQGSDDHLQQQYQWGARPLPHLKREEQAWRSCQAGSVGQRSPGD